MEKIVTVLTKNPIKIWSNKKIVVPLHPQTEKGALDEWLSQRSAKPSTAVRIRQAPQKNCWNLIIDGVPFFKKEGWQSDRSRWTRNPVYPYGYRGFESLTFRQKKKGNRRNGFLLLLLSIPIFLNKPFGN